MFNIYLIFQFDQSDFLIQDHSEGWFVVGAIMQSF